MENNENLSLREHVEWPDPKGFAARLERIVAHGNITAEEFETLKAVADPLSLPASVNWSTPCTPLQDFLRRQPELRCEARFALAMLGFENDPEVIRIIERAAQRCVESIGPGTYWYSPRDFLLLIALGEASTIPHIRLLSERAPLWSFSIACRFRLPESRVNGDFKIIDSFRKWIIGTTIPADRATEEWYKWRQFAACWTSDGFRQHYSSKTRWLGAPTAFHNSPLIEWALEHNHTDWLVLELTQRRACDGMRDLLARLVKLGVPAAVEFCCEQLRSAKYEDYSQYDLIYNVLRFHPRPLPKVALDACVEVIRRPSHPAQFQHRIESFELLVDGANLGVYPKGDVEALIVHAAQNEIDPDVRAAAIDLIPWTNSEQSERILTAAIGHESSKIREAAERVLRNPQAS